jgi:hypothetical protein
MAARVTIGFFMGCLLVLTACTHKPEMALNDAPQGVCDTIGVTYVKDIQPIFSGNCYACHGTAVTDTAGGLNLEDTTSLKNYLQLGFRGDGIYGSKLYHCMLHSSNALPMPPTYIVDSCSLSKVQYWLKQGAPI